MIGERFAVEGADHADVGGHEREGGEEALGGDSTDPAAGGVTEGCVGAVLDDAVGSFDSVAQGAICLAPLG